MEAPETELSHQRIIEKMCSYVLTTTRMKLHPDVIPDDLEREYRLLTGDDLLVTHVAGSVVYRVGTATFFYGPVTGHESIVGCHMLTP